MKLKVSSTPEPPAFISTVFQAGNSSMFFNKHNGLLLLIVAMAVSVPLLNRDASAQSNGGKPKTSTSRTKKVLSGRTVTAPPTERAGLRTPAGSRAAGSSKGGQASTGTGKKEPAAEEAGEPKAAQSPGLAGWIRENRLWMIAVPIGAAVLGLSWFLLAGRRRKEESAGAFLRPMEADGADSGGQAEEGTGGYSSTRISAADVNARLSGSVGGEEVETDQDYALVVEEDALSMAGASGEESDEDTIEAFLKDREFDTAYTTYARCIDEDNSARFDSSLEQKLGEGLIAGGQVEKAVRVLEHHVATHPAQEISAEAYFNLGYAHFHARRLEKSRKFFGLFIETEPDEKRRERARAILAALP